MAEHTNSMGIYGLYKNDECVYVGSSVNVYRRFGQHKNALKSNIHHNFLLQRIYDKYGLDCIEFKVLFIVDFIGDLNKYEQKYIDDLNPRCNISDANGSHSHTEEAKEKMRAHKFTSEHIRKLSEARKGVPSPRKNIKTGFVPRSSFKKGSIPWNKELSGYSTKQKGTYLTEEHKRKLSIAKLGVKRPDVSKALTGRKLSDETKQKISDSVKRTKNLLKIEKENAS